ncbi:MAG: formylglycine-generating enzyme family protein, partial [Anaerolineaceae bacterium]|nr:formylglycine-generating enzyme family protein [Anaerolineaceae bacterium]
MNINQKKPLFFYPALFAVLMACQVKCTPSPTHIVETEARSAPALHPVATQISPNDGMVMVYVPPGEFIMGSTDEEIDDIYNECYDDMEMPCQREWFESELPAHNVYLDAFWIDQTEVTNKKYLMCMQAGGCIPLMSNESYGRDRYFGNSIYDNFPVVYVDWYMASAYCEWAGRRLPTEAEWEKAARGTDGRIYPWGNELPNAGLLNFSYDQDDTTEVGSFPAGASPYGALDMAGNVQEWTADWYDVGYYSTSSTENPQGPSSGKNRVTRGDDWGDSIDFTLRSTSRGGDKPDLPLLRYYLGFRCAYSSATIQPPAAAKTQDMTEKLPPGTKVNMVWVMPDGTPWIYGDTGIFSIDKNGQVKLMFDQPVSDLQGIDQSGRIYALGENYEFIAAYDGQDWQVYGQNQGWDGWPDRPYLSPGKGNGLAQDPQGRIWIATGADLVRLYEPETDTWRSLSSAQLGFPSYH